MASVGTPKTWIPYMNNKDCSQGFCSLYCPQWCYVIIPPPPPFEFPEGSSNSSFSPLVIAIIGILASAFLLASYYTIISKYCGNNNSPRGENHVHNVELDEENHDPSFHELWHVTPRGLDEALVKSITVCKYKKGDGLIEGTDCSVCLCEFEDDQSVRLLPKCSHAFHVPCIDTWLKSHSNCPLCRANIFFASAPTPQLLQLPPQVLIEAPQGNVVSSFEDSQSAGESVAGSDQNMGGVAGEEETEPSDGAAKTAIRALSDLGNLQPRDTIIEIRDEGCLNVRRSVSMDHHSCQNYSNASSSFAEVLPMKNRIKLVAAEEDCSGSTSKQSSARSLMCKSDAHKRKVVLHCVPSPLAMKRSFSSERFFHPNAITPVCGKRMITHQSCSNSERELQFSSRQSQFQGVAYDEFMF